MTMFTLAARAYDFGLRDEAVTWFYRGQNRLITALYVLNYQNKRCRIIQGSAML